MAIKKVPICIFIKELEAALNRRDGYIKGAFGQNPKTGSLDLTIVEVSNQWELSGHYYTQYRTGYSKAQKEKALYWRAYATRVWDANGLAAGIYELYTQTHIYCEPSINYKEWCKIKSADMNEIPKEPGVAVFRNNPSAGGITHVGYLWKPVYEDKPEGDWWVIEAKGVLYGVQQSRFSLGGWNCWGKMTKYFEYDPAITEVTIPDYLEQGDSGTDVRELQKLLLAAGEKLPRYKADGVFGAETLSALQSYQEKNSLPITGIYDKLTKETLTSQVTIERRIKIINNCYVRTGPGIDNKSIGTALRNAQYKYGGKTEDGWNQIIYKNQLAWVSAEYSKLVDL